MAMTRLTMLLQGRAISERLQSLSDRTIPCLGVEKQILI